MIKMKRAITKNFLRHKSMIMASSIEYLKKFKIIMR